MTPNEAFEKWWGTRLATLPWENDKMSAAEAFGAGWGAHEAVIAGISQLAERGTCSAQDAGSTPAAGSSLFSDNDLDGDFGSYGKKGSFIRFPSPGGADVSPEGIYDVYPRKIGKQAALKAIKKALLQMKGLKLSEDDYKLLWKQCDPGTYITPGVYLWAKTKSYAAAVSQWTPEARYTRDGVDTVPHPATWFNRGSYDDDPAEWQRGKPVQTSQFSVHH